MIPIPDPYSWGVAAFIAVSLCFSLFEKDSTVSAVNRYLHWETVFYGIAGKIVTALVVLLLVTLVWYGAVTTNASAIEFWLVVMMATVLGLIVPASKLNKKKRKQ